MIKIGLLPIAERIADLILEAPKLKKNTTETRRRIVSAAMPLLAEAVEIGMDQSMISIDERKKQLRGQE